MTCEPVSHDRMLSHDAPLVAAQGSGLHQHLIRHGNLSQVMQEAPQLERFELLGAQSQALSQLYRISSEADAVPCRVRVARFNRKRKASDKILRVLQRFCYSLQSKKGSETGRELSRMHRLGKVVVGPRFQPRYARIQVPFCGQEHDGNEAGFRICLEMCAQGDPVDTRHAHIEQDQIGNFIG